MFKIVKKQDLAPKVFMMLVEAPFIAKKRKAGQFVIIRLDDKGERIPLTIADADVKEGWIKLVVQAAGKSTERLYFLNEGDFIQDVVGPLGRPTHIENFGITVGIGGGVGIAPLLPITQALKDAGNHVITILGGRSKQYVILEDDIRKASDETIICTDDGSYGMKGFVTNALQGIIDKGVNVNFCIAIGPPIMMKNVCKLTEPHKIKTYVSLNTLMVDGTGMCGACRITVGHRTKFVCVDGPEFDGHLVNFDEMLKRLAMFDKTDGIYQAEHDPKDCNLNKKIMEMK